MVSDILRGIQTPSDIKSLTLDQLSLLAQEIRDEIVHTVSKTGGHLGASLGVVEMTLALHSVLDAPKDKIIWDVGHQAYPHKLLTGRLDEFYTLRQENGISGFPRLVESEYDAFGVAHAGTSISAGLGYAIARDLRGGDEAIVTVTGDGAFTSGMIFEALNHAGDLGTSIVVIINDNEMSIAPNVGALSAYLVRLRMDKTLRKMRSDIEGVVRKIPGIGEPVIKSLERIKDSLLHMVTPAALFDAFGFSYYGPIDGHNIVLMQRTVKDAIARGGPVIIHAVTEKGKGYQPAENDPGRLHAMRPMKKAGQDMIAQPPSYSTVVGETLVQLAKADPKVVGITAAMPGGTGLDILAKQCPNQFFDVGIAEQHAVTLAAGMACSGIKPVAAIYSTFLQRGYDQVVHDVCIQDLPVTFAIDRAGLVGDDGPTHHGVFDIAYLRTLPHMVIMSPKDENELRHMLKTAVEWDGPAAVRYPRGNGFGVSMDEDLKSLPMGRGEVLREGEHLAILAFGTMVAPAREAAEKLAENGVQATVVNARFCKPLDEELIVKLAKTCGRLLTVEEHALMGGFGSAVLELLEERRLFDVKVRRIGIPDQFIDHASPGAQLDQCGLNAEGIYKGAFELLGPVQSTDAAIGQK